MSFVSESINNSYKIGRRLNKNRGCMRIEVTSGSEDVKMVIGRKVVAKAAPKAKAADGFVIGRKMQKPNVSGKQ